MRPALLLLALLVSPMAGAAPRHDANIEFTAPAQIAGSVDFRGLQWAIFTFDNNSGTRLDVDLVEVFGAQNHTYLNFGNDEILILGASSSEAPPTVQDIPHASGLEADLAWTSIGSLLVIAESISVSIDARTELRPAALNTTVEDYLVAQNPVSNTYRRNSYPVNPSDVVSTPNEISAQPAAIHADGVQRLEWFDADIQCARDCLPGGGVSRIAALGPGRINQFSYVAVQSGGGTLNGEGRIFSAAFGGASVAVSTEGYARFANANLTGRCGPHRCPNPDGQAFRANGTLELEDIHPVGSEGRMKAKFTGEIRAASFDEAIVFPFSSKAVTIGALTLFAFAGLAKAAIVLFTRHRRPALEHPRIRHIYGLICGQPGLSFSDLRKLAHAGTGNMLRHLKRLLDEGLVVARPYRNSQRFYENHGRYDKDWQQFAALKCDDNRMLHDWLLARPGSTQSQVLLGAGPDWSRSTLRHAIKALQAAGLVLERKEGRFVYYWAVPLDAAKRNDQYGGATKSVLASKVVQVANRHPSHA